MMLLRTAAELAATGADVIRWFHGLSAGKTWLPSSVGTVRASSSSTRGRTAFRAERANRRRKRARVDMTPLPPLFRGPSSDGRAIVTRLPDRGELAQVFNRVRRTASGGSRGR